MSLADAVLDSVDPVFAFLAGRDRTDGAVCRGHAWNQTDAGGAWDNRGGTGSAETAPIDAVDG